MELNYKEIAETISSIRGEILKLEYTIGRTNIVENLENKVKYLLNLLYCKELKKEL